MPDDRGAVAVGRAWRSVRVRTTLAAAAVTAVAVALAGWLLVSAVEDTQLGRLRDQAEARLDDVEARLEHGVDPQQAVDAAAGAGPGLEFVQVLDGDGATVGAGPTFDVMGRPAAIAIEGDAGTLVVSQRSGAPPPTGDGEAAALPPAGDAAAGTAGSSQQTAEAAPGTGSAESGTSDVTAGGSEAGSPEHTTRLVAPTVISTRGFEQTRRTADTPTGRYTVVAAVPIDEVQRSVDAVTQALWVALPVLVGVVALAAWWFVGRALRPVEAIRAQAAAIGGATIHRRVPEPDTDDEIGRLARTMNAMLARLEAASTRQRQFVSDASHELRSPVAAIRADLEVALAEGEAADWPDVARAALAEEHRLERLLADLLLLASADEAAPRSPGRPVDLAAVVADEAGRPRRVPVEVVGAGRPAPVAGSEAQLARVVTNLVDNAARHARAEVRVTVAVAPARRGAPARARVTVDDDGPGVPPGDRRRVFERFTRLDDARSRDEGGAGLGLAVVRSIVERHGGAVWVEDSPLGGARLVVEMPPAAASPPNPSAPARDEPSGRGDGPGG